MFFKKKSNHANDWDKKLVYSLSKSRIPTLRQLKYFKKFLSIKEWRVVLACFVIIVASTFFLSARFYINNLEIAPAAGGEYSEGIVGAPKYINPLYNTYSDIDSDLARLVFSSLLKRDKNGKLENDLAESWNASADGKTYSFKIKKNITWHNGDDLTIDDIIFTFGLIKDSRYLSSRRADFDNVDIEKIDDVNLKFTLDKPYAAFPNLLTFGIMPQNLWYQISPSSAGLAELNLKPIGSGPYKFKSLVKDTLGNIKSISLTQNDSYYGIKPYIKDLIFKFYPTFEEAGADLNNSAINGINYLPLSKENNLTAKDALNFYDLGLPQVTGLFFNLNLKNGSSPILNKNVRQVLAYAIDRNAILNNVLSNKGKLIDGPILENSFAYNPKLKKYNYDSVKANQVLEAAGYKRDLVTEENLKESANAATSIDEKIKKAAQAKIAMGAGNWWSKNGEYLKINLTALNKEEYAKDAVAIKYSWEKLGVKVNLNLVDEQKIKTDVIIPREFEVLLYSEILGADPDVYAFWHSSQIGENGLNISGYANADVDKLLADARVLTNEAQRKEKYFKFQEIITDELPMIFIYSPDYTYVQSKKIKGFDIKNIFVPSDRFANEEEWYVNTKNKLNIGLK